MLWTVLLAAIAGGATGCREDNLEPDNGGDGAVSIEISETDIYATSATFTMQLSGVSSYAYEIEEGPASDDLPLGEIIFSNAQQEGGNGVFDAVEVITAAAFPEFYHIGAELCKSPCVAELGALAVTAFTPA